MKLDSTLSNRILKAVADAPCRIEELVYSFPDVTWNQVFYEVEPSKPKRSSASHVRRSECSP